MRTISPTVRDFLEKEEKLIGKNALAVLSKSYNLTTTEKEKLIRQSLVGEDVEIGYYLLTQVEIQDRPLLDKVIALGLKSFYFTWGSISLRNMQEVEEYIIVNHMYQIEETESEKNLVFKIKF